MTDRRLRVVVDGGPGEHRVGLKRGRNRATLALNSLHGYDEAIAYAERVADAIGITVLDLTVVRPEEYHTEQERLGLALARRSEAPGRACGLAGTERLGRAA